MAEAAGGPWLDAQPFLAAVAGGMGVGELLHGPSFSLFDSTTAIEIGDPKMDIGLHRSGGPAASADELIAAGGAPVALPPPLLLALCDRLLCLEATWHAGSMLPQTVFTSLYMLQPDRLAPNAPLHAYCVALRSACTAIVDMAHAGAVTEDEDLFVHTFQIRMLDLPGPRAARAALQVVAAAEEALEQAVAAAGAPNSSSSAQQQQQGDGSSRGGGGGEGLSEAQAAALLARVRFRRLLLEAVQSLQLYSQAGVEQARRQCQLAEAQLALVADSASLAAPLEEAPGFVPDINRPHMGLVPPRPVKELGFEAAVEHWRGLLRALGSALHSLLFVRGSWAALKATLVDFAANGNHAIVRSAMHLQLIKPLPPPPQPAAGAGPAAAAAAAAPPPSPLNGGKPGGGKKAAAEPPPWCPSQQMVCREFGLGLASCPSPEAALFIEQAAIAIQGQAYALCLNRCRQRRRLRRQLEDWRNIFDHGFNADVTAEMQGWLAKAGWRWAQPEGLLQGQGPAATWAEREAAACALLHYQLGFPLELYAPCEYVMLYWYCDYLLECQYRLGALLAAAAPRPQPKRPSPGARKRGGGGGGGQQLSGDEAAAALREIELHVLEVERGMAQGTFRAAIALRQLGCTAEPAAPFNAEAERYEQRFGCLDQLFRPELMPYQHFRAATDARAVPPPRVLAAAQASFGGAAQRAGALLAAPQLRALLREELVRHLQGVQRTANANAVAIKLLAATSARAAAVGAGGNGESGAAFAAAAPAFRATYDFKTALASSVGSFYPAIVLKH